MKEHRFYRNAYDAHRGTSFVPEARAIMELTFFEDGLQELRDLGKEAAIPTYEKLWLKHMSAKARCISTMICGPARFPVARAEKYSRWERNAGDALMEFWKKIKRPPPQPRTELDYGMVEKEYMVGSVKIWHNLELNRLQLIFDGKPDPATIDRLKKTGFKWSPKNTAWQRQLTPNAVRTIPYVLNVESV